MAIATPISIPNVSSSFSTSSAAAAVPSSSSAASSSHMMMMHNTMSPVTIASPTSIASYSSMSSNPFESLATSSSSNATTLSSGSTTFDQQNIKLKPHKCDTCGACFARKVHLQRHALRHQVCKPYCCEQCGKCFSRQDSLVRHHRLLHEKAKEEKGPGKHNVGSSGKRNKVKTSSHTCLPCAQVKVRCDGKAPCSRCASGYASCTYPPSKASLMAKNSKASTKVKVLKSSVVSPTSASARRQSISQMTSVSSPSLGGGDDGEDNEEDEDDESTGLKSEVDGDEEAGVSQADETFRPSFFSTLHQSAFGPGHGARRDTMSSISSTMTDANTSIFSSSMPQASMFDGVTPTFSPTSWTGSDTSHLAGAQVDPSLLTVNSLHPGQLHQLHQPQTSFPYLQHNQQQSFQPTPQSQHFLQPQAHLHYQHQQQQHQQPQQMLQQLQSKAMQHQQQPSSASPSSSFFDGSMSPPNSAAGYPPSESGQTTTSTTLNTPPSFSSFPLLSLSASGELGQQQQQQSQQQHFQQQQQQRSQQTALDWTQNFAFSNLMDSAMQFAASAGGPNAAASASCQEVPLQQQAMHNSGLSATLSSAPQPDSSFSSPSIETATASENLYFDTSRNTSGATGTLEQPSHADMAATLASSVAAATMASSPSGGAAGTVNLASLGLPVPANLNISVPADLQMSAENWDSLMRMLTSMAQQQHQQQSQQQH